MSSFISLLVPIFQLQLVPTSSITSFQFLTLFFYFLFSNLPCLLFYFIFLIFFYFLVLFSFVFCPIFFCFLVPFSFFLFLLSHVLLCFTILFYFLSSYFLVLFSLILLSPFSSYKYFPCSKSPVFQFFRPDLFYFLFPISFLVSARLVLPFTP